MNLISPHCVVVPQFFAGLDLGQAQDPSAFAVLEVSGTLTVEPDGHTQDSHTVFDYACRHLERWPLGTSYPEVVERMEALYSKPPLKGSTLAVDQTGVGRAVVDMLRRAELDARLLPITITTGAAVKFNDDGSWRVGKKELVSVLRVLLESRHMQVSRSLRESETLVKELQNFRVRVTAAANEVFGAWRDGMNDDLVLALAVAAWAAERCRPAITISPHALTVVRSGPLTPDRPNEKRLNR
jgi:hypothetical protein